MITLSGSIQILVVDPDEAYVENLSTVLQREDDRIEVTTETGVEAAHERLANGTYDCVVSEYDLSGQTGLAFLEEVRETDRDLPFILFTDTGNEEVASEAISAGVSDYVQKKNGEEQQHLLAHRIVNGVLQERTRRKAEETDERLRTLTETTNDVLWMFPPDWGDVLFVNSAYEEVWGQSIEDLIEDPTDFIRGVHPDSRERVQEAMERMTHGEPIDLEYRVNPKEDFQRWVWVQGEPVYDKEGELSRLVGFVRDITKRKHYEQEIEETKEELKRSNQSLREFAYIASHDLQEPLRMVSSFVGLLDDEYGDQLEEEAEEYMEYAVDGAQRMKRMINSLLQYSRVLTQGGAREPVDANTILDDVTRDLQFLVEDHEGEVNVEELPVAHADPDQLAQVFRNLIKNALEHGGGDEAPIIDVRAEERENEVEFSVTDHGPGIPESEQTEIFKIFRRGADSSNGGGTGIGLAISKRIVQRHGGEIRVDSVSGEGATFAFTIPTNSADMQEVDKE